MLKGTCVRHVLSSGAAVALLANPSAPAWSQTPSSPSFHAEAGGEAESYLRAMQLIGVAPPYPWSIRAFSRREVDSLGKLTGSHPWSARYRFAAGGRDDLSPAPVELGLVTNSKFPWGFNDGPVWAGRGATIVVTAGVHGGFGPISLAIRPLAFRASNSSFPLVPTGSSGTLAFADPQHPLFVDRPQRFGDGSYERLDPGNSYLRVDAFGIAVGVSTANEWWGPAAFYPFILGNNAPGFLHGFLGTSTPVNIGVARAHVRAQWARLEQSSYSPVTGSRTYVSSDEPGHSRFAPGLALLLQPRGVDGLELGLSRFFHFYMPPGRIPRELWTKPFELGFLKHPPLPDEADSLGLVGAESNQLVSVFARWVFPTAGLETYFEYGREDYNADLREAIQEPDHIRSYLLGFAKAFRDSKGGVHVLRGELINFQMPHLARRRNEGGVYLHTFVRQGHTHRGQLLGAPVGVNAAAGSSVSWQKYSEAGKWSMRWSRTLLRERGVFHETGEIDRKSMDVAHELDVSRLFFTRIGDLSVGGALVREFNRNFQDDAWNLQTRLGVRRTF